MSRGREPGVTARIAAISVLVAVERGGWPDRLLNVREGDLDDGRDRRLVHRLVLDVLRWQGALDAALSTRLRAPITRMSPTLRAGLRIGLAQLLLLRQPPHVAVSTAVGAIRDQEGPRAAGLANAVLRRLAADRLTLDERLTFPGWLLERWERRHGREATRRAIEAMNRPAQPFLVALPRAGGLADLAARLAREGVRTEPSPWHPHGLRVEEGVPQSTAPFAASEFVLLDPAAALVARLAAPEGPGPVADLCAAPGGKALLLATHSPLAALELAPARARELAQRLERAGATAYAVRGNGLSPPLAPEGFRAVLVDAPCSGTGTLRRRPDRRQRVAPEDVERSAALARRLLDAAADLVAPGGSLTFAVCSLEPEEGPLVVTDFLKRHPRFEPGDPTPLLGPEATPVVAREPVPCLWTWPRIGELDGFFAVRMRRRARIPA